MTEKHYAYLLVEDEKWWNRRLDQRKKGSDIQTFVRRGKVGPIGAKAVLFYVKLPVGEIRGYGDFMQRVTGTSAELWNKHGHETVFESKEEYDSFVVGRSAVTFIRFQNLQKFGKPTGWKDLSKTLGIKKMPNGGRYLNREVLNSMIKGGLTYENIPI